MEAKEKEVKMIIKYLRENDYAEIAEKLEEEAKVKLEDKAHIIVKDFLAKKNNTLEDFNNIIKYIEDNMNDYLFSLYNTLFVLKVKNFLESYENKLLINEFKEHIKKLKNLKTINQNVLNPEIQRIVNCTQIIYDKNKDKQILYNNYPHIQNDSLLNNYFEDKHKSLIENSIERLEDICNTIDIK